jgi:hypothetical protein
MAVGAVSWWLLWVLAVLVAVGALSDGEAAVLGRSALGAGQSGHPGTPNPALMMVKLESLSRQLSTLAALASEPSEAIITRLAGRTPAAAASAPQARQSSWHEGALFVNGGWRCLTGNHSPADVQAAYSTDQAQRAR